MGFDFGGKELSSKDVRSAQLSKPDILCSSKGLMYHLGHFDLSSWSPKKTDHLGHFNYLVSSGRRKCCFTTMMRIS